MAYVYRTFSASGNTTEVLKYEADENDFLILAETSKYGTYSTPSGWTPESFTNNTQDNSTQVLYSRRATASEPTSVSVTATGSGNKHGVQMIVIKGVDTSTAFDVAIVSRASATAATVSSAAITPVQANALLLHIIFPNGRTMLPKNPGYLKIARTGGVTTSGRINTYYSYSKAAGVEVPAFDIYPEANTTIDPSVITIAFRDDGNGLNKGFVDTANPCATLLHILGNNGETGPLTGTPEIDLTTPIATIQGTTTTNNINPGGSTQTAFEEDFISSGYSTTFIGQDCALTGSSVSSVTNLENEIISLSSFGASAMYAAYASQSKVFGVGDGTNFRLWQIDALNTVPSGSKAPIVSVIEVDGGFESEEHGTVTAGVLQAINTFVMAGPAIGTYRANSFGFAYKHSTMILLGGSSSRPVSMNTAVECSNTGSLRTVNSQGFQSEAQFYVAHSIQVGDGATPTIFSSRNHAIEFPSASSVSNLRVQVMVSAAKFGFRWLASSTCNYDVGVCVYNCGNFSPWGPKVGSSTSATLEESGATVISATPYLYDIGRPWTGVTISQSKEITHDANTDLTGDGVIIKGCVDSTSYTVSTQGELDNLATVTFNDNSNIAITITGNQTALTMGANMNFSGNVYDVEYTGATNLVLTVPISSNSLTTTLQSGAGTITLDTPAISFTINSTETALIQIYAAGTQTVLASTTGTQLVYEYTGTPTYDFEVKAAGFIIQRAVGRVMTGLDVVADITLVADPVYFAGHGLVYTTDLSWSRALNQLTVVSYGPTVRNIYSALVDAFIAQTALRNTAFNVQMNGPNSMFLVEDAEGASDADIENMTDGGVRYISSGDLATAEWFGDQSISTVTPAGTGNYQLTDGSGTTAARAAGDFDQLIKMYGDASHGNFDTRVHAVQKFQINGYKETRVDILETYGITTLEPTLYVVAMDPQALNAAPGNPGLTIVITDHTGAPITRGGKLFDFEILDPGTASGEDILRQINYDLSLTGTYNGRLTFNWPPMVGEFGSAYDTIRGIVEGIAGLHGIYVSRGGLDHPGFTRFQSNDGTYYTPADTVLWTAANMLDTSRVLLYNVTGAAIIENTTVSGGGGYSYTLTPGVDFTSGDQITMLVTYQAAGTAKRVFRFSTTVTTADVTIADSQVNWDNPGPNTLGVDGSTVSECATDYVGVQVEVTDADDTTQKSRIAAFIVNALTTADGIVNWVGLDGSSVITYGTNTSAEIDASVAAVEVINQKAVSTLSVKDSFEFAWSDGVDRISAVSGSSIIWLAPARVLLEETGVSGLTGAESAQLATIATVDSNVDLLIQDQGLDASNPKTITENTAGTSYDETFNTVTKEIRKSGSSTVITRTT